MQDRTEFTPEAAPTISLREYGDILRRRRTIILQTLVIVLVAGILITLFQTPTYQATARLLVRPPSLNLRVSGNDGPLGGLFDGQGAYNVATQVEMLNSRDMQKSLQEKIGGELPKFDIEPVEGTTIIVVKAEGDNPDRVATAANKLLTEYVNKVNDNDNGGIGRAVRLADQGLKDAQAKKSKYERELLLFREKNHVEDYDASLKTQQETVATVGANYRQVHDKMAALDRQKTSVRNLLNGVVKSDKVIIPTAESDAEVRTISQKLAELRIERKGLDSLRNVPLDRQASLDGQIRDWQNQLARARATFESRNKVINPNYDKYADQLLQIDIEQSGLAAQAADMSKTLAETSKRLSQFPAWEQQHRRLQQEIQATTKDLEFWNEQAKTLDLREKTKSPTVSVIDEAVAPSEPIRPKRAQNIFFSFVLGAFLGLCLALLQELFDDRINSPEEAERVLRLPSLGQVPLIEEEGLRMIRDISTFSPLMESYRSLRTNINFAAVGAALRTMVVTSSVPAEGKSTTVANLAMSMAMEGKRVIIVDADLRRPSQHKLFKIDSSPGLTDILLGTHRLEQVLRNTGVPNVQILPAGTPPPNPAELLGSAEMMKLIERLKDVSDLILFDSPPALAVADSIVLSSRVDGVLLVIAFGETKKANTRKAQELLGRANANLLGTVLNRMESPTSGYYYGKYYVPATLDSLSESPSSGIDSRASEPVGAISSGTTESKED
jgi:succinoglycan biosynthesis transport protein ExoP